MVRARPVKAAVLLLTLAACDNVSLAPDEYTMLEPLYVMQPDHPTLTLAGPIVFTDSTGSYRLAEGQVRLFPQGGLRGQATRRWRFVHSPSDSSVELVTTVVYERFGNQLETYDAAGRPLRAWTVAPDGRLLVEDAYCHPVTNMCVEEMQIYLYNASPLPITPYEP